MVNLWLAVVSVSEVSSGFSGGITFVYGDSSSANSFNECLNIDATDQTLFLRPMGISWSGGVGGDKKQLTFEGSAEYYWEMLLAPLQR